MSIRKWVSLGVLYVVLVFAGYGVLAGENPLVSSEDGHEEHRNEESSENESEDHDNHNDEANQEEGETMEHEHGHEHKVESEVKTSVAYENNEIVITLEDETGAAPELAVEHDKEMHFIIISNDLEAYYHVHPEKEKEGSFSANQPLGEGTYQAFVDIAPKNKDYQAAPNPIQVGTVETAKAKLTSGDDWTKEIDGKTVTLKDVEIKAGNEVTFEFDTHGNEPETYLGALGHVVIVDEEIRQFIHVHPASNDTTAFNTHFSEPGFYKVWAEFKFDNEIHVYPFVIEVVE
jgi:hypothetical protein